MYSVAVLLTRCHAHLHLLLLLLHLSHTTPPINPRTPTHGSKEDERLAHHHLLLVHLLLPHQLRLIHAGAHRVVLPPHTPREQRPG